ncbi:unnamed protein product [Cuscuta epithymum]|uniref:Uncharacterized protein n=1 Tax=Cuscuta epithymum TaxID=186058 RepID=A0AAV0F4U9_9ASTE|nr:unnamed protein product [Cuscuta epithymum]
MSHRFRAPSSILIILPHHRKPNHSKAHVRLAFAFLTLYLIAALIPPLLHQSNLPNSCFLPHVPLYLFALGSDLLLGFANFSEEGKPMLGSGVCGGILLE